MSGHSTLIPVLLKQPADGTPYRPSNGTEGEGFIEGFCNHCKRDRAYRESGGNEPSCEIVANTMAYDLKDPQYPKEWIWRGGEPVCTAFDDESTPITNEERAAQVPLI